MSDNIYIVYETTNLINGKFYIGVHKLNGRNYLGSGTILINAIKKYGRDNFVQETLKKFHNKQDALNYEELIVDNEMVLNDNCYNITIGGNYPPTIYGEKHSDDTKRKISLAQKGKLKSKCHCESMKINHADFIRGKHPRSRRWYLFGKIFHSLPDAVDCFGVNRQTISNWCRKYNIPHCYVV